MKRRVAVLLFGALITSFSIIGASGPAGGLPFVCAGQGTATLSNGFTYPVIGPVETASFTFDLSVGKCKGPNSAGQNVSSTGTVTGQCGLSEGSGTAGGRPFTFTGVGSMLILQGNIKGVVNASPDVTTGQSCTREPGATRFLITGALAVK